MEKPRNIAVSAVAGLPDTLDLRPFFFLRHGETDWNLRGLTQGRTDVALNGAGVAQAHAAARLLAGQGATRIVASTLARARHTAEIVGATLSLPVTLDEALCEARFGEQEGRPMGAWYDRWVAGDDTPGGGESFADLRARAVPAINRALQPPGLALVVAHGALFRAVRAEMGLSPLVRTPNGVPSRCIPGAPWTLTEL